MKEQQKEIELFQQQSFWQKDLQMIKNNRQIQVSVSYCCQSDGDQSTLGLSNNFFGDSNSWETFWLDRYTKNSKQSI
ncbi:unnamed protein product [Paramecium octaurelia]|uniref:Uncharacterized protein n=1 Tax=Paramecium octaurelia TaxID=43137 RepID=A0A8S1T8C5_PAROT|nr:unnamed protein product [Paramecium octaurelia]